MARRRHQPTQSSGSRVRSLDARELTHNAKDLREEPYIYANHAMFSINPNEIFIDLYHLGPEPGGSGDVQALLIQRLVIPIGLGKGFATGLANAISGYERALGTIVPINRTPEPEDAIKIWDQE